jgi:hypothetical protein
VRYDPGLIKKTKLSNLDVKNAFKVRSGQRENERHVILFCQTAEDKAGWLNSLVEMQTAR